MFYIQNVGITLEFCWWRTTSRSENAVYVSNVAILNRCVRQRPIGERKAVVSLVILPPADVPYESVIVERDTPAACTDNRIFDSSIKDQRLVNHRAFGVGYDRPVGIAIAGTVVEIVTDRPYIIEFDQEADVGEVRASIRESSSQSRGVCVFREAILTDKFIPVSEVQA